MCKLTPLEEFSAYLSAAIHDVHHQGLKNDYESKIGSTRAIIYSDQSVMEYYHLAVAFSVLKSDQRYNLFKNLTTEQYTAIRSNMIYWVLGTDNLHHATHVKELVTEIDKPDFSCESNKKMVMRALLHAADLANGTRPIEISKFWSFAVLDEFFAQGDLERT